MSEIQVKAKYSSVPGRILLYTLLLFIPLWGVAVPILFLLILVALGLNPKGALENSLLSFSFLGGLLALSSLAALASIALADDKLIVNKEGIRIPFHLALQTWFRRSTWGALHREYAWSDVEQVLVAGNTNGLRDYSLCFQTRDNGKFEIRAKKLSEPELEKVFLALELWGGDACNDERLLQLKEQLQLRLSTSDSDKHSYTAIWGDELERRFSSTAFVVLEPDANLRDDTLTVVRQLSFGGLSAVYLCQRDKRELVVLKESVLPVDASDELTHKAEEMFAREARFLMHLKHPNIVGVIDYFVEKNRNYLLLDYVNGIDLKQYVRQHGPQPEYRVIEWAKTLAEVLTYLHKQDPPIIHRDISPDNIVLDGNHNLKIIDFGAANEFIGTATGTLVGKQSYLPLEQLRGKSAPQSDIYALGGTLHFLLTGEDPEPLATSHPRSVRTELSEEIDRLISVCTDQDFKKRPQTAAELHELLNGFTKTNLLV